MIIKEENKKIDIAWDKLYGRLEEDGLLNTESPSKRKTININSLKWVAAIAILCLSIASILVFYNREPAQQDMLTLNNEESSATLVSTLEDGSVVYLSEYASLHYPTRFADNKREVSLQGDAFFDISKNAKRPFVIDTKFATIEVLGTSFNVKSNDNTPFSLSVKTGEVRIISKKGGRPAYVAAGETAILQSEKLYTAKTTDIEEFSRYLKQIHFKDERLADVIRVINTNSESIQLKISPAIENRLLTLTFSGTDPTTMAQLICMALNLKSNQDKNTITISE